MNQHISIKGMKSKVREKAEPGWKLFLILFATKPIIDLLWEFRIVSFGGVYVNPPRLVAILLLPVLIILLIDAKKRNITGRLLALLFLLVQLVTIWTCIVFDLISPGYGVNILFRGFDAFLLYFLFARYWTDRGKIYQFFTVIWLSILVVNIISVYVYFAGGTTFGVSGGVARYSGLYNDAGGPAYNGVFSIIFASLIVEMSSKSKNLKSIKLERALYYSTIATGVFLIGVSITKSAMIMLAIFVVMWWGFYKKRFFLLLPAGAIVLFGAFSDGSLIKQRFSNETRVFIDGNYDVDALAALGTGRYAHWLRVIEEFGNFTPIQMMFGVGRSFGAHNQFLAYLMMFGIIGLFLFLVISIVLLFKVSSTYAHTKLPELMCAKLFLVIFLAISVVGHPFLWSTSLWYLMILLSLVNVQYNKPHIRKFR